MSVIVSRPDFSPVISSFRRITDKYLPDSSDGAWILLESSALTHLAIATLKNLPYVLYAEEFGVNDFCHFFSCRFTYLEATVISLASLVHNVVMALIYTPLAIVTFGMSTNLNYAFRKHWSHVGHAVYSIGIGILGTLIPTIGASLTASLFVCSLDSLNRNYTSDVSLFEDQLIREIKRITRNHRNLTYDIVNRYVSHERQQEFCSSIKEIESRLKKVKNIDDLNDLVRFFFRNFLRIGPAQSQNEESARRGR